MDALRDWYAQSCYEQAYENLRNEDENHRVGVWQYLAFAISLVAASIVAPPATRALAALGTAISVFSFFYLARVTLNARYWMKLKDTALARGAVAGNETKPNERWDFTEAHTGALRYLAPIGGWILVLAYPLAGFVFFGAIVLKGPTVWAVA